MEDEDDTNGSEEHFFTRTRLISFIFTWASGNRSSSYVNGLTHEFIILLCEEILIRKARRGVSLFLAHDLHYVCMVNEEISGSLDGSR